jgi:hypothetical protein
MSLAELIDRGQVCNYARNFAFLEAVARRFRTLPHLIQLPAANN